MALFKESFLKAFIKDQSVGLLLFEAEKSKHTSIYEEIFNIFTQKVNCKNFKIVPREQIFFYKTSNPGIDYDKLVLKELLNLHKYVMGYNKQLLNKRKYINFKST